MRGKFLLAIVILSLASVPVPAGDEVANDEASAPEETVGKYGCGERVEGTFEEIKRPLRRRYVRTMLSPRELREWGPIRASGTIGCDGRVHDLKIDKKLPEKLEAKLRKRVGKLRYKPATRRGEPIAVGYSLILNPQG